MTIYIPNGQGKEVLITKEAQHEEELMKSDFVKLSWNDTEKYTLPVDSYIIYKDMHYFLLEPYEPEQKSECEYKYEPQFQHQKMRLSKVTFKSPQEDLLEWPYTGTLGTLLQYICDAINEVFGFTEQESKFMPKLIGELKEIVTVSFSSTDVLSALSAIANVVECEWHIDWEERMLYFGHIAYTRPDDIDIHGDLIVPELTVDENVNIPSVRNTKEGYWNAYDVRGGTRNIFTRMTSGEAAQGTVRLKLNEEVYPSSIVYTDGQGRIITKEQFDVRGETPFIKPLVFDDVYPKTDMYVYDVRYRERYLMEEKKDNDGNTVKQKVQIDTDVNGNPIYKRYAVWYVRLAVPTLNAQGEATSWEDYTVGETREAKSKILRIVKQDSFYTYLEVDLPFNEKYYFESTYTVGGYETKVRINGVELDTEVWGSGKIGSYRGNASDTTYIHITRTFQEEAYDQVSALFRAGEEVVIVGLTEEMPKRYVTVISDILNGKKPILAFQPNTSMNAQLSLLAGLGNGDGSGHYGFEVKVHTKESAKEANDAIGKSTEEGETGVITLDGGKKSEVKAGDFEIILEQDNLNILPATKDETMYPRGFADPSLLANKVNVYNVIVPESVKKAAQTELANEFTKWLTNNTANNNSYTLKSNPVAFEEETPKLYIGRKVKLINGDFTHETRVMKIVTQLDYDFEQEITVGNEVLKGSQTQLKEQVQKYIYGGGGGGVSSEQVERILEDWVTPRFLTKIANDKTPWSVEFGDYARGSENSGAMISPDGTGDFSHLKVADQVDGSVKVEENVSVGGAVTASTVNATGMDSQGVSITASGDGIFGGLLKVARRIVTKCIESFNFSGGDSMFGTGFKLTDDDGTGHSKLIVDNLVVRMKAVFQELEVRKLTAMGGNYVFSPAASVIEEVDYIVRNANGDTVYGYEYVTVPWLLRKAPLFLKKFLGRGRKVKLMPTPEQMAEVNVFRCWLRSDDGSTSTINTWAEGMLARCQTFDVSQMENASHDGTLHGKNVENKLYWRAVVKVGQGKMILDDGLTHSYVDLSNEAGWMMDGTNDRPSPKDHIVCFGDWKDRTYSNLIVIETAGDTAPAIREYVAVGYINGEYDAQGKPKIDWTLDGKEKTRISPLEGTRFIGRSFTIETDYGTFGMTKNRGSWIDDPEHITYYKDDIVQHNGSSWLCVVTSTQQEPGTGNHWEVFAEKGGSGSKGDTPIQLFGWFNTTPTTSDRPQVTAAQWASQSSFDNNKWYKVAQNRPQGDNWVLYMSQNTLTGTGTIDSSNWSNPIQLSGENGSPGEDGKEREWIYRLDSNSGYDNTTGTIGGDSSKPVSGQTGGVDNCRLVDDFVPTNWSDSPSAISKDHPTEYASFRIYDHEHERWGAYQTPIIWSHWGRNGMDGDGVEYVFVRTQENVKPTVPTAAQSSDYCEKTTGNHPYTEDDHLPYVRVASDKEINGSTTPVTSGSYKYVKCTDDPAGTDDTWKHEWVLKRSKGSADQDTGVRQWEAYSGEMSEFSNHAESNLIIDLDNQEDQFGTDSDSKVVGQQVLTTGVTILYGTQEQVLQQLTAQLYYASDEEHPIEGTSIVEVSYDIDPVYTTKGTVTVTIKNNATIADTGIFAKITATCARGSKTTYFNLGKVKSGAPGVSPTIYQLNPSLKTLSFGRNSDNTLTPNNRRITVNVLKTVGNATTEETSAVTGVTYDWGWDDSNTAEETGKAVGSYFDVSNANANSHSQVWIKLNKGDKETLPIVKDGEQGQQGADGKSTNIAGVAQYHYGDSSNPQPSTPLHNGDVALLDYTEGYDMIDIGINGRWEGDSVPFGTCYIYENDKHLYEATETGWLDLGKFEGDDGVNVISTPAGLIVNQDINNPNNLNNIGERVTYTVMKGSMAIAVNRVVVRSVETYTEDGQQKQKCFVGGSESNYAILNRMGTYYDASKGANYFFDRAYFIVKVYYSDNGVTKSVDGIKTNIACQLVGTWKETIIGDTKSAIAQSTWFDLDQSGNIVESNRLGTFIQSSTQNLSRLSDDTYINVGTYASKAITLTASDISKYGTSYRLSFDIANCAEEDVKVTFNGVSYNAKSYNKFEQDVTISAAGTYQISVTKSDGTAVSFDINNIRLFTKRSTKFSEFKQTTEGFQTTVSNKLNSEQLLPWEGWWAMGILETNKASYHISVRYDYDYDEGTELGTPEVYLPAGDYCFFFYTDYLDSYDYEYVIEVYDEEDEVTSTYERVTDDEWGDNYKHIVRFTLTEAHIIKVYIEEVDGNDIDIYRPMLNSGSTPKTYNQNVKMATESSVSQTANAIVSKVEDTTNGLSSQISQKASSIDLQTLQNGVVKAGITLDGNNSKITLNAATTEIKDGNATAAMFTNGKIVASFIDADTVVANGLQAKTINAQNATINNITLGSAEVTGTIHANAGDFKGTIEATGGKITGDINVGQSGASRIMLIGSTWTGGASINLINSSGNVLGSLSCNSTTPKLVLQYSSDTTTNITINYNGISIINGLVEEHAPKIYLKNEVGNNNKLQPKLQLEVSNLTFSIGTIHTTIDNEEDYYVRIRAFRLGSVTAFPWIKGANDYALRNVLSKGDIYVDPETGFLRVYGTTYSNKQGYYVQNITVNDRNYDVIGVKYT